MKQISISKDVFPLGVFKSKASGILKQLNHSQRPVVITQNGSPAAVLITPETYDEMVSKQEFMASVEQGLKDYATGDRMNDDDLTEFLDSELGSESEK